MKTIIKTFASGLRLAFNKREGVRSVGIAVFCGVGSQNETLETNGLSHFIEHTVFKGTTTRSSFDIVNDIESIGAQINAYTSKQNTCFYTLSVDTDVDKCAEILSDILFNSTFDKAELDRERKVVIEEIAKEVYNRTKENQKTSINLISMQEKDYTGYGMMGVIHLEKELASKIFMLNDYKNKEKAFFTNKLIETPFLMSNTFSSFMSSVLFSSVSPCKSKI